MKSVLAIVPYYLPYPGGAEQSMHEMLRRLVSLGVTAEALVPSSSTEGIVAETPSTDVIDGVSVRRLGARQWLDEVAERVHHVDLVFYSVAHLLRRHFDARVDAILSGCRRRVVYFCRGREVTDYFPGALVVANSEAVSAHLPQKPGVRTRVLRPIVSPPLRHPELPRRFVTLINPSEFKGGRMLLHLARRFPGVSFVAQLGRSTPVGGLERLSNVTIRQPERDLSRLYAETDVLLVPTKEEPFGRVALEGALAGCRLLLHRAFGLREVPVPDFCFVESLDPRVWERRLSELLVTDAGAQAEMRDRIERMAATYDPGWHEALEDIRRVTSEAWDHPEDHPASRDGDRADAHGVIRGIDDLFTNHFPSRLKTYGLTNQPGRSRCKIVVTGADRHTWIIETSQRKTHILRGDGDADATVTVSGADILDLARGLTTVDFLRNHPERLSIEGDLEAAAHLARLFV